MSRPFGRTVTILIIVFCVAAILGVGICRPAWFPTIPITFFLVPIGLVFLPIVLLMMLSNYFL